MKIEYYLVTFPESQYFDVNTDRDCFICMDLDGALFVPKSLYEQRLGNLNEQGLSNNISSIN